MPDWQHQLEQPTAALQDLTLPHLSIYAVIALRSTCRAWQDLIDDTPAVCCLLHSAAQQVIPRACQQQLTSSVELQSAARQQGRIARTIHAGPVSLDSLPRLCSCLQMVPNWSVWTPLGDHFLTGLCQPSMGEPSSDMDVDAPSDGDHQQQPEQKPSALRPLPGIGQPSTSGNTSELDHIESSEGISEQEQTNVSGQGLLDQSFPPSSDQPSSTEASSNGNEQPTQAEEQTRSMQVSRKTAKGTTLSSALASASSATRSHLEASGAATAAGQWDSLQC